MEFNIQMGLRDPSSLGEPLHELGKPDLDLMRKAIVEGQRDSELIRRCLIVADMQGWSGEDRYVYLAYMALITVERQWKEINRLFSLLPNPAPIMKPGETPND